MSPQPQQPHSHKQLSQVILRGFKSIYSCDLKLGSLNVLIGPNGAGKSNFISLFRMIQALLESRFQAYVSKNGGPYALLHQGMPRVQQIGIELYFGQNGYLIDLEPTQDNRLMFAKESFYWQAQQRVWDVSSGHFESAAETQKGQTIIYDYTIPIMQNWRLYHFHDTGDASVIKQQQGVNDNLFLRNDGGNLAPFLYRLSLQHPQAFQAISDTVKLVAPFFQHFILRPNPLNTNLMELEWLEAGKDVPFKAYLLSDGTLRFICLATVLLQPEELQPETIVIDEPELGLHPYAITVLASLIKSASKKKQIIISTQSTELLNEFDAEDVIVADRQQGHTQLRRLNAEALSEWLQDYTLGELWNMNHLGGRPSR